ncbi:hypothetical protein [Streptomyces sp. NPDC093598]|uniref:hypothetical protein n=1 Tax=Streptomyces sp. NPDC093598 TaxID=3366046 RepID=UPI0038204E58
MTRWNNRIELDRLSVIKSLADALDVTLGDLLAEPTLLEWTADSGTRTVPALRSALMNYRQLTPLTRHNLEMARALSAHNRMDDALTKILEAESWAPEQVRSHYLARELVLTWVRNQRCRPSRSLADLANRLHVI